MHSDGQRLDKRDRTIVHIVRNTMQLARMCNELIAPASAETRGQADAVAGRRAFTETKTGGWRTLPAARTKREATGEAGENLIDGDPCPDRNRAVVARLYDCAPDLMAELKIRRNERSQCRAAGSIRVHGVEVGGADPAVPDVDTRPILARKLGLR